MSDIPAVCCIVLTWNDRANLLACLESLSKVTYRNMEIVVSDNGSTDGSIEAVRADYPGLTLIENGENLRWSGGNNVGIEYAMKSGADYIILLNNDTLFDPEIISELVEAGESDPSIGVLGPKIYYHSEPDILWFAGGEVSLWRGLVKHRGIRERDSGQYDSISDTDYVTGCALMMKREVVEKIGLIDPRYIAYAEDTDFSLRAARAGFRLVYVPRSVMWHKIGAYWGVVSRRKIWHKFRSHCILFRRFSPPLAWFTTIPLFFLLDGLRIVWLIATGRIGGRRQ